MTCKVAQNTLLSSQTTTTHEAKTTRPSRPPPLEAAREEHTPPPAKTQTTHKPTPRKPNKQATTHGVSHTTTNTPHNNTNNTKNTPNTPKTPQQTQKPACRVLRPRGLCLNRPPYRSTRFPTGVSPVPRNLLTRNKAASFAPCLRPVYPMRRPRRHVQR